MAKKKIANAKKLLPHREVKVKSRAYGEHTRAARGSQTPVAINEVLQANVRKTAVINQAAKRVHDLLKHCGKPFKEAMLWQVMLSRMRKATSDDMTGLLTALNGLELNSRYPLKRFARLYLMEMVWGENGCEAVIHKGYPHWKSDDTEYRYEVFLLTLGREAEYDGLVSAVSEWMRKEEKNSVARFTFEAPPAAYYVLCVHFMTGKNGKETGTLASRGMQILAAGKGSDN